MFLLRLVWLVILVGVIPMIIGTLFRRVDHRSPKWIFGWISGQMVLWAGFELITVPLIVLRARFELVVILYSCFLAVLFFGAVLMGVRKRGRYRQNGLYVIRKIKEGKNTERFFWCLFVVLLIFQLIQAVRLAYGDGDDAYYVATAGITESSNTMYRIAAYTGETTDLEIRYGLAPLPVWIAYLSRVTGIRSVSVALVCLPPILIAMTYAIYALIASRLLGKRREYLPLFMILIELLIMFGNYSFYSAENFLLARSRQGKAALANMVIPMLFFLLFILVQNVQEERKTGGGYWFLLIATLLAACLCSTMGGLLTDMLVGITGLCTAFSYKRWKLLIPMFFCCVPSLGMALLYMWLG